MSNDCPLCNEGLLGNSFSFLDSNSKIIETIVCSNCHALIPQYENADQIDAVAMQTHFHEEWWKDCLKEHLQKELLNIKSLISYLHPLINVNLENDSRPIIEIGAGRGALLRGLISAGYNAFGCEPAKKLVDKARQYYCLSNERLFNESASDFICRYFERFSEKAASVVLWHVLEHVKLPLDLLRKLKKILSQDGTIILQLPLFHKQYIYPEHYFFVTHDTIDYIAEHSNMMVSFTDYDVDNYYLTICLKNSNWTPRSGGFLSFESEYLGIVAQLVLLRDASIEIKDQLLRDRWVAMQSMEKMIQDRDRANAEQAQLLKERWATIQSMEKIIQDRDRANEKLEALRLEFKSFRDFARTVGKLLKISR